MERFAEHAWGELGQAIVEQWSHFNERYFAGELHPIPIIITPTLPYGRRIADCWSDVQPGRGLIRLNVPRTGGRLVTDNNTLLHEMVHQCLFERGEDAKHRSDGWRREIMLAQASSGQSDFNCSDRKCHPPLFGEQRSASPLSVAAAE